MKYNLGKLLDTQYKYYAKIWCHTILRVRTDAGDLLCNANEGEWSDYSEYSKTADKKNYEVGIINERANGDGLVLQTVLGGVWDEV